MVRTMLIKSGQNIESELRLSPEWVAALLVLAALAFTVGGDVWSGPGGRLKLLLFAILLYAIAAAIWLCNRWRPRVGRWFTVGASLALVTFGFSWLGIPGFLTFLVIPVVLAAALIGLGAVIATATVETLLLLLLPKYVALGADPATIGVALASVWTTLSLMLAIHRPMVEITRGSWEHFQRAQKLLEEARTRKVELKQALDDLLLANRELALLNERIAAMRLMAEEAQKTKTAFVAKVSHEFRTPLNMIIGLTDVLVETPELYGEALSPALLEDLKIVHRNCEHLSSMIDDVLDLSQTEMGRLTLHREWVDLSEDLESALAVVRPLLAKKNLDLKLIAPDDLPQVYCDRTRIRQVILNLVSNAARFTQKGGVMIQVELQERSLQVSVSDTGPGISPEDADMIFEPFCQGTANLWREREGTGLGLSISKQFIELHDGRIWLESEPGLGSTFSFKLPISPPTATAAKPDRWVSPDWVWRERPVKPKGAGPSFKRRIVLCDETGDLYALLAHYSDEIELIESASLSQAGHELDKSPAHALLLNSASPHQLWPLVEQVGQEWPDTPIIACSFLPRLKQALEAGAINYLVKPVRRSDLKKAIEAVGRPVKRVLVVDDDPDVQRLLSRILSTCQGIVEIGVATRGRQALEQLRQNPPDLMLLDIALPDMDGWQILKLKNREERISEIPVMILSAQDPIEAPLTSPVLLTTIGQGLSVNKLLHCSLELSRLLLKPG